MKNIFENFSATGRKVLLGGALAVGLFAVPVMGYAQQAAIVGSLGNFDVLNNTGEQAHG